MRRRGTRLASFGVLVVAVAVAAVVVLVRLTGDDGTTTSSDDSALHQAMTRALPDGRRFLWTDWAGLRADLDGSGLSIDSSRSDLAAFLRRGFDSDLSSSSALVTSAPTLQEHYTFSPATLDWELFSQGEKAAVEMLGLGADADMDALTTALRTIGYTPPDTPDGVWRGNLDDIKRTGDVTPELTFLVVDAERHVVLGSDTESGVEAGRAAYEAGASTAAASLDDVVTAVDAGAGPAGQPRSATLYSSDQVCGALAMSGADPADQAEATDLIDQAGPVNPLTGFAMAIEPSHDVLVAMSFETAEQARTNATTRAQLASGPAVGQGGDFSDRFTLGPVVADGLVVTMTLQPQEGAFVESDLSTGPLLFATC